MLGDALFRPLSDYFLPHETSSSATAIAASDVDAIILTTEPITGDTASSPISTDELHSGFVELCVVGTIRL